MEDAELDIFRQGVNCAAVLERMASGWKLDVRESNRLPPRRRARCRLSPSGDGLHDLLVAVEQVGGDGYVEGLLVDAERDGEGAWDFEAPFTVRRQSGWLRTAIRVVIAGGDRKLP